MSMESPVTIETIAPQPKHALPPGSSAAAQPPAAARGFTILAVLFAIVILALIGTTAYLFGTTDGGSAQANALRAQALAAAEAGMTLFSATADPTAIPDETDLDSDSLVPVELPNMGATGTRTEYVIVGAGNTGTIGQVIVEGRVLQGNSVLSRARLTGVLMMEQHDDPYEATAGVGPTGANVQYGGRRPFVGGPGL